MVNKKSILPLNSKFKKGDLVKVITGKHKGKTGPITAKLPSKNRVFVEGISGVKHQKPTQENQQGGKIDIPVSLHVSNVMIIDSKSGKKQAVSRIGYIVENNKKTRIFKKSGSKVS